jgi:hypothetical protein
MRAVLLLDTRIVLAEDAFAELVLWQVPRPVSGSTHSYKYRLAYVVNGVGVVRYDNETGKGDHRHVGEKESVDVFTSPDRLIEDFEREIARWNRKNRHA